MRILIAEDEMISRKFIYKFLSKYGECDLTIDGGEAIDAYMLALDEEEPYDLVCLDIMMPDIDGIKALKVIRNIEKERAVPESKKARIIMTTALNDVDKVQQAFDYGSEGYAVKPINTKKMIDVMKRIGLL
ncbi:MAG: response regulator [Vallitaleaceae bacterium]|jgi:two-component system chemotaxis response regulator CheY|nr:response regulator [Vallitaleaceae bacterium]